MFEIAFCKVAYVSLVWLQIVVESPEKYVKSEQGNQTLTKDKMIVARTIIVRRCILTQNAWRLGNLKGCRMSQNIKSRESTTFPLL